MPSEHVCCTWDKEVSAATVIEEYVPEECYPSVTCMTVRIYLTASTDAVITNLPDASYVCAASDGVGK